MRNRCAKQRVSRAFPQRDRINSASIKNAIDAWMGVEGIQDEKPEAYIEEVQVPNAVLKEVPERVQEIIVKGGGLDNTIHVVAKAMQ